MRSVLYAPWREGSRATPGWAALGLTLLGFALSNIPVIAGAAVYVAAQIAGGASPDAAQAAMTENTLTVLLPLIAVQFAVWGGLTLLWVKLYERRSLASIGLSLRGALGGYASGLVWGVGLVMVVGAAAATLSALTGGALLEEGGAGTLAAPAGAAVLAVLAGCSVFLIQGAMEEVIFRGWLMSTLAARWGLRAAVVVSSVFFMIFHAHVFVSGLWFGLAALTGLGLTGLVFALLCVFTRSLWEALAAHGAFNFAAVAAPTLGMLASDPTLTAKAAFAEVFGRATGMAGVQAGAETWGQALAAGAVCAVLAAMIARRAKRA
ncbi:MAG: CPBP family intramembrane glutamic endopeptidase [Oceanicaulis sp.]